eukprot:g40227.t1
MSANRPWSPLPEEEGPDPRGSSAARAELPILDLGSSQACALIREEEEPENKEGVDETLDHKHHHQREVEAQKVQEAAALLGLSESLRDTKVKEERETSALLAQDHSHSERSAQQVAVSQAREQKRARCVTRMLWAFPVLVLVGGLVLFLLLDRWAYNTRHYDKYAKTTPQDMTDTLGTYPPPSQGKEEVNEGVRRRMQQFATSEAWLGRKTLLGTDGLIQDQVGGNLIEDQVGFLTPEVPSQLVPPLFPPPPPLPSLPAHDHSQHTPPTLPVQPLLQQPTEQKPGPGGPPLDQITDQQRQQLQQLQEIEQQESPWSGIPLSISQPLAQLLLALQAAFPPSPSESPYPSISSSPSPSLSPSSSRSSSASPSPSYSLTTSPSASSSPSPSPSYSLTTSPSASPSQTTSPTPSKSASISSSRSPSTSASRSATSTVSQSSSASPSPSPPASSSSIPNFLAVPMAVVPITEPSTASPTAPSTAPPTMPPTLPPTIPPTVLSTMPPTTPPTAPPTMLPISSTAPPTFPPTTSPTIPPTLPPTTSTASTTTTTTTTTTAPPTASPTMPPTMPPTTVVPPRAPLSFRVSVPMLSLSLDWTYLPDDVVSLTLTLQSADKVWMGFAISNQQVRGRYGMGYADYNVVTWNGMSATVTDMFRNSAWAGFPSRDTVQSLQLVSSSRTSLSSTATWSRKLAAQDSQDWPFPNINENANVLFACGTNDKFGYHGANYQTGVLSGDGSTFNENLLYNFCHDTSLFDTTSPLLFSSELRHFNSLLFLLEALLVVCRKVAAA